MSSVRIIGRRRTMPVLLAFILAAVMAAPSALAQNVSEPDSTPAPEPPAGFTMGGQGYLLDDGEFTPIAAPDATGTLPFGINDKGQIVGTYDDQQGFTHGFVFERGRYRTIDHPEATGTHEVTRVSGTGLVSINNRGQAVGSYVGPDNHQHGFLYDLKRDRFRIFPDAPGATDTGPFGLNDRGQITVQAFSPEEPSLNFLFEDGEFTRIEFPDAVFTLVHKIDNRGQVVGVYTGPDEIQHGFTLRHGRYRTLDFPDAPHTGLNDSNSRGQIVGYVLEGELADPTALQGAIFSRGKLTTFDAPGPPEEPGATTAYDINSRGQIVGAQVPLLLPALQRAQAADQGPLLSVASTDQSSAPGKDRDRPKERDRDRRRHR